MVQWRRTHTCGELREEHIGQTVLLCGWVNTTRAYNDQVFIDLRDRYGITQIVVEPDSPEAFAAAHEARAEWVLAVRGKVRARLPEKHNPKLETGDIEVLTEEFHILNRCPTPPFEVMSIPQEGKTFGDPELASEDLRLQYRYLDLRRPKLQRTLETRHRMNQIIRESLSKQGFLEIETPLLGRSTPEGARDYLVPSRVWPGQWYALPQSPQLYKQLLMVAGYDKYFQIARCLRDEDLRAHRQPEFTQLDLEMSFVDMIDIFKVLESLTAEVFRRCLGVMIPLPLERLKYDDAKLRFGTDKPDPRYRFEITDLSDLAGQTEFKVFRAAVESGGKVRGLNAEGKAANFSNKELESLPQQVEGFTAKELIWAKVEEDKLTRIDKFLPAGVQQALRERLNAKPGDLLLLVAGGEEVVCQSLTNLRAHLARKVTGLKDWWVRKKDEEEEARKERRQIEPFAFKENDFKLAWVIDFPLFSWDKEEKRWAANHHPFTAPMDEDLPLLESDPGKVRAKAYDLVLNGYELGGGSIRIHNPEIQSRVFSVLGMSHEEARQRFGFLLDALKHGAPPHGGIALGLDRWTMWLAGTQNIRDVIAFPKNQKARDLMTGAPAEVDKKQLKELGF
jgi:aspartyl-tRNA synthetase